MKKLQLKALALGAAEMLTREQLKNVFGGGGSGSGSGSGDGCSPESCPESGCSEEIPCPEDQTCYSEMCGCGMFSYNHCA
jgi:hypothetical protein